MYKGIEEGNSRGTILASILPADFWNLGKEIASITGSKGADRIHLDIMDGCFVPNISFGLPVLGSLRPRIILPLDVHLMVKKPDDHVDEFIAAGADLIIIHTESDSDIKKTLANIKKSGSFSFQVGNPALL